MLSLFVSTVCHVHVSRRPFLCQGFSQFVYMVKISLHSIFIVIHTLKVINFEKETENGIKAWKTFKSTDSCRFPKQEVCLCTGFEKQSLELRNFGLKER